MSPKKTADRKTDALREVGALNPHPEDVTDPLFEHDTFFDPRDLVQVKYEMLRRVRVDGESVTEAAKSFGFSRPTFYEAKATFDAKGLAGLVPKKRGPQGPHKLRENVVDFLREQRGPGEPIGAASLVDEVEKEFGITVHKRSIERAWQRRKKKRR